MNIQRVIRKLRSFPRILSSEGRVSYSQFGEDVIITKLLEKLPLKQITYLDIGANEPFMGSNTYALYERGYRGVLIEPNPALCRKLKSARPGDTILNIGIANSSASQADYYMFDDAYSALNTFSKEEAANYEQQGIKIARTVSIPLVAVNELLEKHFKAPPTFVSIDVEGLDEDIIRAYDYSRYAPLMICIETVIFSKVGAFKKRQSIIDLLLAAGYFVYADTHVNTIFCHQQQYDTLIATTVN